MGPIGMQEMIFIVILALLLFGPKKLPELARLLGKGMSEFRRAKNELKSTFDTHLRELERETRMEDTHKTQPYSSNSETPYSYVTDEYGKTPDYTHDGSAYPSEPAVGSYGEAHENPAVLSPAPPVSGTIPRSSAGAATEHEPAKDESPA